ncbi:MAG: hypothetical protein A2583_16055 [Bdellovibrionales bacterium RIFOXYD1_FULL_53_11]|nr:MAG: hypothetical protein A2583_16055 [Bdellovibrionales bacterium RIFOXYD1_FULL_53_11]
MHKKCLPKHGWKVLNGLELFAGHHSAVLAGGTALALQIGHRISYDLDFFTPKHFKTEDVIKYIRKAGSTYHLLSEGVDTLVAEIDGMKFSVFTYEYPFIEKTINIGKIKIASINDIAAMNLIAVSQRGTKRDFVDLYYVLQEIPFHKIAACAVKKFGRERINPVHIGKSLVHFSDAEGDPEPRYIKNRGADWGEVKGYFIKHIRQLVYDLN